MQEFSKRILVFWILVQTFVGKMTLLILIVVLDLAQIYFNLLTFLDHTNINFNDNSIKILALVLTSFMTRAVIFLS